MQFLAVMGLESMVEDVADDLKRPKLWWCSLSVLWKKQQHHHMHKVLVNCLWGRVGWIKWADLWKFVVGRASKLISSFGWKWNTQCFVSVVNDFKGAHSVCEKPILLFLVFCCFVLLILSVGGECARAVVRAFLLKLEWLLAKLEERFVSNKFNKRVPPRITKAVVLNTVLKSLSLTDLKLTQVRSKECLFQWLRISKELKDRLLYWF